MALFPFAKRVLLCLAAVVVVTAAASCDGTGTGTIVGARMLSASDAAELAASWMARYSREVDTSSYTVRSLEREGAMAGYVVEFSGGGFAVTTAIETSRPIVAYSSRGQFEPNVPYADEVVAGYIQARSSSDDGAGDGQPGRQGLVAEASSAVQLPLLTTEWGQSGGRHPNHTYNKMAPFAAPVGCTAVALGQVLKYYDYPKKGLSSIRYCNTGASYYSCSEQDRIDADFSVYYGWDDMPPSLDAGSSAQSIDAVSELLFHVGAALKVRYAESGSSTQLANPAVFKGFRKHFRLGDVVAVKRDDYSLEEWKELVRHEILSQRPVVFSGFDEAIGAGHAYVLDGLDENGFVHVNWGWSGSANGYYDLTTMLIEHPRAGTLNFTEGLVAYINFTPNTAVEGERCNGPEGRRCALGLECFASEGDSEPLEEFQSDAYGSCREADHADDKQAPAEVETAVDESSGTIAAGEWLHFGPYASVGSLQATLSGTGDADIYVRAGARPDATNYDCRPYKGSTNERCDLEAAGLYYVSINGYADQSEYGLSVRYERAVDNEAR